MSQGSGESIYLNNPDEKYDKSVEVDEQGSPNMADIEDIAGTMMPSWKSEGVTKLDLTVTPISGGITNKLFLVKNNAVSGEDDRIIVRLYGNGTDLIINRDNENKVFAELSMRAIGPSFLGVFGNGRVEQYISCSAPVTEEMMNESKIARRIAQSVAVLHSHRVGLPDKSEVVFPTIFKFCDICEEQNKANHGGKFDNITDEKTRAGVEWMNEKVRSGELRREVEWLKGYLDSFVPTTDSNATSVFKFEIPASNTKHWHEIGHQLANEVVFCHNDLLSGNILLGNPNLKHWVTLIDYEYAGYNRAAYDIANHFCEFAGVLIDVPDSQKNCWPSKEHRLHFLRNYLERRVHVYSARSSRSELMNTVRSAMEKDKELFNLICEGMDTIVCKYAMAAHMLWGVWALIQASMSSIDFDYLGFAKWRIMDGYYYHKSLQTALESEN